MNHTMTVRLLGVRGTLPVHGAEFARFGGGTSSVLVRAGGATIVLDAGTGLSSRAWAAVAARFARVLVSMMRSSSFQSEIRSA